MAIYGYMRLYGHIWTYTNILSPFASQQAASGGAYFQTKNTCSMGTRILSPRGGRIRVRIRVLVVDPDSGSRCRLVVEQEQRPLFLQGCIT